MQFDRLQRARSRASSASSRNRERRSPRWPRRRTAARRFQAFEESLKNSRDYKINDLQRCCKDVKSRLDTIEGDETTFLGLHLQDRSSRSTASSPSSARCQMQVERAEAAARRNEVLFFGALARRGSLIAGLALHLSRAAPRSGAWRPGCPSAAGPSRRPISRPSVSIRIVVGMPITLQQRALPWRSGRHRASSFSTLMLVEELAGAVDAGAVDASATTSNLSEPSSACSRSSAGISLRQGAHQVAHRFKSTTLPRKSGERSLRRPPPSTKAISGSASGCLA